MLGCDYITEWLILVVFERNFQYPVSVSMSPCNIIENDTCHRWEPVGYIFLFSFVIGIQTIYRVINMLKSLLFTLFSLPMTTSLRLRMTRTRSPVSVRHPTAANGWIELTHHGTHTKDTPTQRLMLCWKAETSPSFEPSQWSIME